MLQKQIQFNTFSEFYPFYLSEHKTKACKILHFIGTSFSLFFLMTALFFQIWFFIFVALLFGYGFAWIGHFVFEKNRPASFKYPLYSFAGDWFMYWQLLSGKLSFHTIKD